MNIFSYERIDNGVINLIDNLRESALIIDMRGKIIFGNRHALQMYGYTFDELINLNIINLTGQDFQIDMLLRGNRISSISYNKNGKKISTYIDPIYINEELGIIITSVTHDAYCIHDILENNSMMLKILELFDDAFVIISKDFNVFQWSKSAEKRFGYSRGEIIGKNIKILIPEEILNEFEKQIEIVTQDEVIESYETKRIDKYGILLDVSVTLAPLYDCSGRLIGIFGIYKDISEKIKLEEQLKESEERLRLALEGGIFGVWDWNIISNELYSSYLFNDLLGYNDSEMIRSYEELLSKVHTDDKLFIIDRINKHFHGEEFDVEFRMRCKDNNYIWIRSKGKVNEWTQEGKPSRMVGIHEDISDKKIIEEELEEKCKQLIKLKEEAENANKAKSQFLANMSHEIRTPMNGIFGMVQLIKSTNLDNEQKKYLELINDSLNNLKVIIDDILDISKIESGKLSICEESFDLRKTVNSLYSNLLITGNAKGLEISYYLDPDISFKIISDELKIKQILNNLVSNAVKFTNNGFISFRTKIIADYGDTVKIEFRVKDTGIGIEDKYKNKLFHDFSQADISTNKKYQGTGLGLAISKRLADMLKGEISFESKFGEGSTFIFTCEFIKDMTFAYSQNENYISNNNAYQENKHEHEFTILCVEDNIIGQEIMGNIITKKGYKYLPAYNGREALSIVKENKIDLILMDIQLPELNGFQTTELIKKEFGDESNIPIIAITAYAMHEDRQKCIDAGMVDYISKPFDINEFYEIVETYLK